MQIRPRLSVLRIREQGFSEGDVVDVIAVTLRHLRSNYIEALGVTLTIFSRYVSKSQIEAVLEAAKEAERRSATSRGGGPGEGSPVTG